MADSAVEQILQKVETILLGVEGIKVVSRDGVDALSIQNFPAVVISVESDVPNDVLLDNYLDRTLTIALTVWVAAQSAISKTLEAFKALVKQKMAADPYLGLPNKLDSFEGPSSGPFPLNEALTESGEIIQYTVRYRTTLTDPFTLVG